jgi:cellulose synthase/poly-beta-1,6-N-acetylglucosamine synthase-like glycosyltransferase
MNGASLFIYMFIAGLSFLNFIRIFALLIGSDIYDIVHIIKKARKKRAHAPAISVIIPAYNEETGVIRTIESVMASTYSKKEIIVVNDGSTDQTKAKLRSFQRKHPGVISIINQPNAGKAEALNNAIFNRAKSPLVMVLDADSLLHPDALHNMVAHFRDRRVIAAASNVKILPTKSTLGLSQRIEYLISYRMKRSMSIMNMEYIVGGVGSTFRRSALLKVGGYDTDTMTEDIDLTVKLIKIFGNTKNRIHYAADSVAYTEHVLSFASLVKQRFRWKYGRFQTLLKNKDMFFNKSKDYDKKLTWIQLPYALIGEFVLLVEPLLIGYILWVTLAYGDGTSLLSVYVIVSSFIFLMLLGENTETTKTKLSLSAILPLAYILMYILAVVEFLALVKSIRRHKLLLGNVVEKSSWQHVERSGQKITVTDLTS